MCVDCVNVFYVTEALSHGINGEAPAFLLVVDESSQLVGVLPQPNTNSLRDGEHTVYNRARGGYE